MKYVDNVVFIPNNSHTEFKVYELSMYPVLLIFVHIANLQFDEFDIAILQMATGELIVGRAQD